MVSLTGGTFAEPRGTVLLRRGIAVLGAVLLVGGLLVGGLAAGGVLPLAPAAAIRPVRRRYRPDHDRGALSPARSVAVRGTLERAADGPRGLPGRRLPPDRRHRALHEPPWVAAADGRDAHVLEGTSVVGWSADGSRLLLENRNDVGRAVSLLLADPTGTVVTTIEIPCMIPPSDDKNIGGAGNPGHLCPDPGEFALSPDGTRVAFTRSDPNVDNASVVSVLDLVTGQSTMLTATRTTNPTGVEVCNTSTRTRMLPGVRRQPPLVAGRPEHRLRASAG